MMTKSVVILMTRALCRRSAADFGPWHIILRAGSSAGFLKSSPIGCLAATEEKEWFMAAERPGQL